MSIVVFLVRLYRATLGRFLGGQCRYEPSCSQYLIDACAKHGVARGTWRGTKRICRCNPFSTHDRFDPA